MVLHTVNWLPVRTLFHAALQAQKKCSDCFRFVSHIFSLLPKLHGFLKTSCLECVLSRADAIPDIVLQLKTSGFVQIMGHR